MPLNPQEKILVRSEAKELGPLLGKRFFQAMECLSEFKSLLQKPKGKNTARFGTKEFFRSKARRFKAGRNSISLKETVSSTDPALKLVVQIRWGYSEAKTNTLIELHKRAEGAENYVGWLLECYIARSFERHGWIWCSGAIIPYTDFIWKEGGQWKLLQIKNRSNSENAASKAARVRAGIPSWHRTLNKNDATNWATFPRKMNRVKLSEKSFLAFIKRNATKAPASEV